MNIHCFFNGLSGVENIHEWYLHTRSAQYFGMAIVSSLHHLLPTMSERWKSPIVVFVCNSYLKDVVNRKSIRFWWKYKLCLSLTWYIQVNKIPYYSSGWTFKNLIPKVETLMVGMILFLLLDLNSTKMLFVTLEMQNFLGLPDVKGFRRYGPISVRGELSTCLRLPDFVLMLVENLHSSQD